MGRPRNQTAVRPAYYIATESFSTRLSDGNDHAVVRDVTRIYPEGLGAELLERYPNWFKPLEAHYGVEAATSGPGEERP